MKNSIILDTNVVLSALQSSAGYSNLLLKNIEHSSIQLELSNALVLEYKEILLRKTHMTLEDIESLIDYFCLIGKENNIHYLWRPILKDQDDDFVLELAVKTSAIIITFNVKDFQKAATTFDIQCMTPHQFLQLTTII